MANVTYDGRNDSDLRDKLKSQWWKFDTSRHNVGDLIDDLNASRSRQANGIESDDVVDSVTRNARKQIPTIVNEFVPADELYPVPNETKKRMTKYERSNGKLKECK